MSRVSLAAQRAAEAVGAAIFTVMVAAFLLQIFMRYVVGQPLGWTIEICMMCFVWLTFWGNAFLLRDRDHVAFTMLYEAAPVQVRRVLALLSAASLLAAFAVALGPTYDFVSFMERVRTDTLRLPFNWVYAVFIIFMAAVITRSALRVLRLLGRNWRETV